MISISEARSRVLEQAFTNPPSRRALVEAVGHVLAEPVISDIDSPPHDKSLMDGFAVCSSDEIGPGTELEVLGQLTAGQVPDVSLRAGSAVQIMTGAPLPAGADAVVILEQTEPPTQSGTNRVRVTADHVQAGQNIMRQGVSIKRGNTVLPAGHIVRAIDVGLLAEVGCSRVPVVEPPRVAVLATGNELVDAAQVPTAGMIRNSNGPLLCALSDQFHAAVTDLGIAPDTLPLLSQSIELGLQHDVLVLSGGVSAGLLDLVPQALERLGVKQVFHKVRLKPGKPMWFGRFHGAGSSCLVFGLPGNPVGSLVCFELFVAPLLRRIAGHSQVLCEPLAAELAVDHQHRSDRPTYHPAISERRDDGHFVASPLRWHGSADQRALAEANSLMLLPPGTCELKAGESVQVVPLGGRPL